MTSGTERTVLRLDRNRWQRIMGCVTTKTQLFSPAFTVPLMTFLAIWYRCMLRVTLVTGQAFSMCGSCRDKRIVMATETELAYRLVGQLEIYF